MFPKITAMVIRAALGDFSESGFTKQGREILVNWYQIIPLLKVFYFRAKLYHIYPSILLTVTLFLPNLSFFFEATDIRLYPVDIRFYFGDENIVI